MEDADLQDSTIPGNQGGAMQNPNNLAAERGRTDNNRLHSAVASVV
jgi:hypothetical protein